MRFTPPPSQSAGSCLAKAYALLLLDLGRPLHKFISRDMLPEAAGFWEGWTIHRPQDDFRTYLKEEASSSLLLLELEEKKNGNIKKRDSFLETDSQGPARASAGGVGSLKPLYTSSRSLEYLGHSVAVGDLDGDSKEDVIVGNWTSLLPTVLSEPKPCFLIY